jgi:SAM-dependent methyltransferase
MLRPLKSEDASLLTSIRLRIRRKRALSLFYEEVYRKYAACLARCPTDGIAVELGSGGGFVKSVLPCVMTSDVVGYPEVDCVVDATRMPFDDESLRAILMMNVFHHIPDVVAFLNQATRCLKPGGRIFMLDQHLTWFSRLVYRYGHAEPFDPESPEWRFEGRLSGANGALAYVVFERDRHIFEQRFPRLRLVTFRSHTPLRYFLAGGLRNWTLLPGWASSVAAALDDKLIGVWPTAGSFVDIEIVKSRCL